MNLKSITLLITLVIIQSCATKKNAHLGTHTFWISGYKTACDAGAGKAECLQVFNGENLTEAHWENFYSQIEGFEFELGYLQKIEVKTTELSKMEIASDRSSIKYTLVKVLEKKSDSRMILNGDWKLSEINGIELENENQKPILKMDLTKKQVSGTNGCNNYSGIIQNVSLSEITFGKLITTLKACIDMKTANAFDTAFQLIKKYKVEGNQLTFFDESNKELMTFTKSNLVNTRLNDIWVAEKMNGTTVDKLSEMPRIELNLRTMKVMGTNSCNQYNGAITELTDTKIVFGPIATTRKMCPDMETANAFDKVLSEVMMYKLEGLHLFFYNKEGKEIVQFLKVD